MHSRKSADRCRLTLACVGLFSSALVVSASASVADDPLAAAVEAARKTHDERQLQSVKTQLEQKTVQNPNDAGVYLDLVRVQQYLMDDYENAKRQESGWRSGGQGH